MNDWINLIYFLVPLIIASAVPLSLVALGGLFSESTGVINIALEGIMVMGAFIGIIIMRVLLSQTDLQLQTIAFLGLFIGGTAGGIYALLHAFAAINMRSNQIISATALNMFAPALSVFTARIYFNTSNVTLGGNYLIRSVPVLSNIPVIGPLFFTDAFLSTYIGLLIFIIAIILLYKTRLGLRMRSCGENPHAADSLGINIYKIRYIGVVISGVLAGMGGVIFVLSFATRFSGTVMGFGFLGLAVMIFGQWNPKKILLAAFFFATILVIASAYTGIPGLRDINIPQQVYNMLPFIATLVVLSFASKSSRAPKAIGEPFDQGKR